MANIGDTSRVGTICPQTGQYKHTACTNTEIYNKSNKFAPCSNTSGRNRGADWKLQKKLT